MDSARKRRKWDVAAPGGMPLSGNRAGIGAIGSAGAAKTGLSGFITAQGLQIDSPDVSGPSPVQAAPVTVNTKPLTEKDIVARAQQEAQAVVERINAELRAKGQMPPMRGQSRFQDDSKDVFREVVINDAPHGIRMELIKRSVQDDIQRRTHTIVVIKGRYQPPGGPPSDMEGPLRLRVMPGNVGPDDIIKQRAVDNGASEIRRIMQGGTARNHAGPANHAPPPDRLTGFVSAGGAPLQPPPQQAMPVTPAPWQQIPQQPPDLTQSVSLYVAVEAPPDFNLIFKLRGPGDSYLQHISGTTGASVTLRGRGAGGMYDSPDHLHLFVTAPNHKSFEDAKGLAVNLIDTVRAEHATLYAAPTIPQQPTALPAQSQAPMQSMPHSQAPTPMPMHSHAPMQTQQQQAQVQMPMHSQASPGQQQAPVQQHNPGQGPAMAAPESPTTRLGGPQWQQTQGAHSQPAQAQGPYSSVSQPPHQAAPSQPVPQGPYLQQYPPTASHPMSNPYSAPGTRPPAAHNMSMPQPTGSLHPSHMPAANMSPGQRLPPGQAQNAPNPAGPYQPRPGMHGPRPDMPYGAAPAGPFTGPHAGPYADHRGQQHAGHAMQQQQGGYPNGPNQQGGSAAQAPLGPVHGPHRPPEMSQDRSGGSTYGGNGRGPEQNGRNRSNHNSMNASDVQAQQAERKRRFTEQKAEARWKQGQTQQPNMPAYAQRPQMPQPVAPLPADLNPPLPMGPPPPRPPVQFKLGSMGPPPPRFNHNRVQGGQQGAVSGPPQGLVPYGDDD